ncbi:MAG: hypothetical protein WCN88_01910 [Candidatus Falkowbacteria bacterium]
MISIYELIEKITKPLKIFSLILAISAGAYFLLKFLVDFIASNWILNSKAEIIPVWFMLIFLVYHVLNYKLQKTNIPLIAMILWPINIIMGLCLFLLSIMNHFGLLEPVYKLVLSWPNIVVGINMLSLSIGHYSRSRYLRTSSLTTDKKDDGFGLISSILASGATIIFCAQIPLLVHNLMRPEYRFEAIRYLSYTLDFIGIAFLITFIFTLAMIGLLEEANSEIQGNGNIVDDFRPTDWQNDWQSPIRYL